MLYNKDKVPFKYVIGYKTGDAHQFLYQMLKYLREQNRADANSSQCKTTGAA